MKKLFFLFCFAYSFSYESMAQPEHYRFTHLTVNDGLSHNQVTCFLKDRKGFMWIGSQSGLNRFDGYTIKVFRNDPQDSTSLPNNNIFKLFETPDGKIGIATGAGLSYYDPAREIFQSSPREIYEKYKIRPQEINDVVKDKSGSYWILHNTTGMVHVSRNGIAKSILPQPGNTKKMVGERITSLVQDVGGQYWAIHANGALEKIQFNGNDYNVTHRHYIVRNKENASVLDYRMLADASGNLWIYVINDNQGLYFFDVNKLEALHIDKNSTGLKLNTNIVSSLAQDNSGTIWVGTDHGGINLIDKERNTVAYN